MELGFYRQTLKKYPNIKFHENPSSEAELLHVDGQTDVTKLIVAFRNFAKAPKIAHLFGWIISPGFKRLSNRTYM